MFLHLSELKIIRFKPDSLSGWFWTLLLFQKFIKIFKYDFHILILILQLILDFFNFKSYIGIVNQCLTHVGKNTNYLYINLDCSRTVQHRHTLFSKSHRSIFYILPFLQGAILALELQLRSGDFFMRPTPCLICKITPLHSAFYNLVFQTLHFACGPITTHRFLFDR